MMIQEDKDISVLFARLDDLYRSADQGILGGTSFLSPRELHFAMAHLRSRGQSSRVIEWGGYSDAERKKLFVLPEYMEGITDVAYFSDYGFDVGIAGVSVLGSGYRTLSHRDFLGSLMNLGLDRSSFGDIVIIDNVGYLFCKEEISEYVITSLERVKHTDVKLSIASQFPEGELYKTERRKIQAVGERLDAVVAKVFSLSRDESLSYFKKSLVFADGRQIENNSYIPKHGEKISVRGLGRFIYLGYETTSKKGKLNIAVDLYL